MFEFNDLYYKPEGRRNIRRPQTRWGDDFREEGRNRPRGLSLIEEEDDDYDVDDDDLLNFLVNPLV